MKRNGRRCRKNMLVRALKLKRKEAEEMKMEIGRRIKRRQSRNKRERQNKENKEE
jgi:hypothetical protein